MEESFEDYKPLEPGVYLSRFYYLLDLGTSVNEYSKKKTKRRSFFTMFEVLGEVPEGCSNIYGAFLAKTKLEYLVNHITVSRDMTPEKCDIIDRAIVFLGSPVFLHIGYKDYNQYRKEGDEYLEPKLQLLNIYGVLEDKDEPFARLTKETFYLTFDNWDEDKYHLLSNGMKGLLEKSEEFQKIYE